MCNVQPRSDRFPVLLTSDIWPVAINTLFGLTNGLFASLAMVSAPRLVSISQSIFCTSKLHDKLAYCTFPINDYFPFLYVIVIICMCRLLGK